MKSLLYIFSFIHSFTLALDEFPPAIHIPDQITAGTTVKGYVDVEVHNWDTTYCNGFRVYLTTRPGEPRNPVFYHEDCYLVHEQSLCDSTVFISPDYVLYVNTSFTFSIPASVGPSGRHYVLKAQTLKTDGSYYGAKLESDVFELIGATGDWGSTRSKGRTLWGDDGIPCESYECVMGCAENVLNGTTTGDYGECANACPNVYIDPTSTVGGQPTGVLSSPSSCSVAFSSPARTQEPRPTSTKTGNNFVSSTPSRTAVAAAPTGASSSTVYFGHTGSFIVLVGLLIAIS